jgi:homoserine O-acetyltransferase
MDPEWKRRVQSTTNSGSVWGNWSVMFMVSSPLQWQKSAPTREEAEEMLDKLVERYLSIMDANDMIYAESSRFYNPAPHLAKKKCLC